MTREEEIKKQVDIYTDNASNYTEWGDGWEDFNDIELVEKAFTEGAKWADRTMIEKACDFLVNNMTDSTYLGTNTLTSLHKAEFIQRFKEVMEE